MEYVSRRTRLQKKERSDQNDQGCFSNLPYQSLLNPANWPAEKQIVYYAPPPSELKYIEFALNGRYIASIEVKKLCRHTDSSIWRNYLPISQLLLMRVTPGDDTTPQSNETNRCSYRPDIYSPEEDRACATTRIEIAASIALDLIEVYCVEMSTNTTQFAVYGFSHTNMPRKPVISIYEIHHEANNEISLSQKTKVVFEDSQILYAKLTACKFLASNSNVLVTAICNDFHSVTKTNSLDFWNTQTTVHLGRFNLVKVAPKFQGYVTSMSFSSDGLILAMTSSSKSCQLLLHSTQTHQFGPVFCQQEFNYQDQEEHFLSHSSFAANLGDYVLLVCTYHGHFYKFTINPENLAVDHVIFKVLLDPCLVDQPMMALDMKYCLATSSCLVRTQVALLFVNAEDLEIQKAVKLYGSPRTFFSTENNSLVAVSRTGQEVITICDPTTLQVHFQQNPDCSLKNICRQRIIQLVSEDRISQLPLPKTLISYLLYNK